MPILKRTAGISVQSFVSALIISLTLGAASCNGNRVSGIKDPEANDGSDSNTGTKTSALYNTVSTLMVLPKSPLPGEPFRILATGGSRIRNARISVTGPSGSLRAEKTKNGGESPYWRIDDYSGNPAGKYNVTLSSEKELLANLEFEVSPKEEIHQTGEVWKTERGWDSSLEEIYSAWINALFKGCSEQSSWSTLHEVTQNKDQNFLYNYLSLEEDNPKSKSTLIMQPDCADNPFYLRAYFAWKLGLPFGFHICDRGSLVHNPRTGQWITNETSSSRTHPVAAFNSFLRMVMNGVHSGTARTALDDENSDYYPVPLEQETLRPGTVFADPYGHTLIITGRLQQTRDHPGMLLAVDAQPDGTVGIKRFWKGNFLFNTSGVIGEPGFKAFRPISLKKGVPYLMRNKELTAENGFVPYSQQQKKMESGVFYRIMERLINPEPLDPEAALLNLIQALHEQLMVRVTSVANGEAYFKLHTSAIIPMPSSAAGIFQAGGQWEDFSTPNRDLRLLIAMDAVVGFPELVARSPGDFNIATPVSAEKVRKNLQSILDKKTSELTINYTHSDGSLQTLTVREILSRRDAFEMAYNPNDGVEIRWGAPQNSNERARCRRHAPSSQVEKMQVVRTWFTRRLHPPT